MKPATSVPRCGRLDRARAEQSDFQILLTRYALERLLYRLSVSEHRERFILKGAMLFVIWVTDPFRPTRDLDLLGRGDPSPPVRCNQCGHDPDDCDLSCS